MNFTKLDNIKSQIANRKKKLLQNLTNGFILY